VLKAWLDREGLGGRSFGLVHHLAEHILQCRLHLVRGEHVAAQDAEEALALRDTGLRVNPNLPHDLKKQLAGARLHRCVWDGKLELGCRHVK
jgi:hypothetical protein